MAVEIPFTPRAKRVLELSLEEARQLGAQCLVTKSCQVMLCACARESLWRSLKEELVWNSRSWCMFERVKCLCLAMTGHNYIGTEHILLGLLREGEGVAARVLETLGADPSKIRTQVCEILWQRKYARQPNARRGYDTFFTWNAKLCILWCISLIRAVSVSRAHLPCLLLDAGVLIGINVHCVVLILSGLNMLLLCRSSAWWERARRLCQSGAALAPAATRCPLLRSMATTSPHRPQRWEN